MASNNIKANKIFTIFFAMFFILYKFQIVQIGLFFLLGFYVLNHYIKKRKVNIKKDTFKNIGYLLLWFGVFVLYVIISKTWAIGIYPESRTIRTLLRMLYVGFLIFLYCDNKEKAISVIKSYIYGVFIMCLVVLLFTPPSLYGVEAGENFFGKVISQHRNTIGGAAAESILYIYLISRLSNFKHKKKIIAFLTFMILISGSRGALVEIVVFFLVYALMNIKNKKLYKYIPIFIVAFIVIISILYNVEFLYNKFIVRINDMVNTILYNTSADGSTYSRRLMKKIAFGIFKKHPILGAGVDGVEIYLAQFPVQFGRNFRSVYSHCNYSEIAANFGIVGLIIWYGPILILIKKMLGMIKKVQITRIFLALFIAMIFIDNYKIPWSSDVEIFSYFSIMTLILIFYNDLKLSKYQ